MQTQSFLTQTPLFQGFPLPKRKLKEDLWVSSSTEVPVFGAEASSQMLPISFGEGDKGGEDQRFNLCKRWGIIQHLITNNRYDCLLELIQKLMGDQAFGTYLNDFYTGNKNANFPTFFAHTRNRLELSELYIYGSGRLGNLEQNLVLHAGAEQQAVWNPFVEDPSHLADSLLDEHESIASTPEIYTTSATHKSFVIGQKRYEISNHLGNVSSVITDRKFGVPLSSTDPTISYYLADIVTATDYDPYGQVLPGRVWKRTGYRFGFNGQELDSELGEVWSAEFWEYDASLGRRWDIDPIDLPWQSPYLAFDCNPIAFSDPLGLAAQKEGDGDGKDAKGNKKDPKGISPKADTPKAEVTIVADVSEHAVYMKRKELGMDTRQSYDSENYTKFLNETVKEAPKTYLGAIWKGISDNTTEEGWNNAKTAVTAISTVITFGAAYEAGGIGGVLNEVIGETTGFNPKDVLDAAKSAKNWLQSESEMENTITFGLNWGGYKFKKKPPVQPYEVGSYKNLAKRSIGDGLDIHHAGQSHPFKQSIKNYDHDNAPAIALPRKEHTDIPTLKGIVNVLPRDQLAKDIKDLRKFTSTPTSQLIKLITLNKSMYPDAFKRSINTTKTSVQLKR